MMPPLKPKEAETAMRSILLMVMVLAALPILEGCASVASLGGREGCQVYGGTRLDATMISESLSPNSQVVQSKKIEPSVRLEETCCGLVDMPFSFVADTVLLPITVPIAVTSDQSPKDKKAVDRDH
ncbi:MAG: YceK/YidQ family lipoprotein [Planctomycetes bacterium]|nr:YceK/YidQ family lipoprotein [Planctomycetota bacterium]